MADAIWSVFSDPAWADLRLGDLGDWRFNFLDRSLVRPLRHPPVRRGTPVRLTSAPKVWLWPTRLSPWRKGWFDFFLPGSPVRSSRLATVCEWGCVSDCFIERNWDDSRAAASVDGAAELLGRTPPEPTIAAAAAAAASIGAGRGGLTGVGAGADLAAAGGTRTGALAGAAVVDFVDGLVGSGTAAVGFDCPAAGAAGDDDCVDFDFAMRFLGR